MAFVESWLEGPRWNNIEAWIMKAAMELKLKCSTDVKSGVLRKTVFYKVEGEYENLVSFKKAIETLVCSANI